MPRVVCPLQCLIGLFASPPVSRSSSGRERSEKPPISGPPSSRSALFNRGSSSKELLENQTADEPRRDREREGAEPRRTSVTEDKTEPERRVRESGEGHLHEDKMEMMSPHVGGATATVSGHR